MTMDDRYFRYKIEASSDNTTNNATWVMIVDRTDPTNECRSWQDISFNPPIQARYLRLTGTYGSSNTGFYVVEWEVYGPPAILTSANAVTVPEGTNATFQVKLNYDPVNPTTVTVSQVSGDEDITVQLGTSLVFNASDWSNYQMVTLAAVEDPDMVNSSAVIRCSASGVAGNEVTATERDNDVVNLALASRGSTIMGSNGRGWSNLIDGVTTGYTGTNGWGSTVWTSSPPGSMTLDLKGLCAISSMRFLLYDVDNRYYRYKIEASSDSTTNNATWVPIMDRMDPTNQCRSWQDINFSSVTQAWYLRLTGTYGSSNTEFHVVEWEVYGTPPMDISTSADAVTVPEGGTTNFQVKLNNAPVSPTTVTVSWVSGDTDITVQLGNSLVFDASNWNTNQTVMLGAALDPDQVNGSAVIQCSALGLTPTNVTATEQDNTLVITTTFLPTGVVNTAYSATLAANGGTLPYTWLLAGGSLPSGLALATNGAIAGIPTTVGLFTFTGRVSDAGSPVQTTNKSLSITITSTSMPTVVTMWSDTTTPTQVDGGPDSAVELGVKFKSDATGTIAGIRFYKATANTGTHVGNLWSSAGMNLATATFSNETASGWQQVLFATPVAIASNTVYVASYHANDGHYSADPNYFLTGVDNPPLHALANGVSGGNGVYAYGLSSVFPTQTWNAANYWVDVVFQSGSSPTLTSIAVTPLNPTIGIGASQQFAATGTYSDGSTQNLSNQVTWTSSNTLVATIDTNGLATGVSTGTTTISAALVGVVGTTTLTVQPVTYTITPAATDTNGSIMPDTPVTLDAGHSTSFVVSAAADYYIASLTTNGAEVWGVAGLYAYTSWWNNVQADGALTAAFASVTNDTATNGTSVPWLRQYYTNEANLEALKELANLDTDVDGMLTWEEYWSRTDPTNSNKFLHITAIQCASGSTGSVVRWTSETDVVYRLTSSTNLLTDMFTTIVSTNIPATPPINVATDETAIGEAVLYYRIGVER